MASLSFIMDVNDDHPADTRSTPDSHKRDQGSSNVGHAGQPNEADTRHVTAPDFVTTDTTEQDTKQAAPSGQTRRLGGPSRGPKSASATPSQPGKADRAGAVVAASSTSSCSSPSLSASTTRRSTRRPSTTTDDSMDWSRYGQSPSSSSMGKHLQRPLAMHPAPAQFTPKITPKTGRVSKAKKGLPVHICEVCNPPKTFTRAEHLRRHQLGHGEPRFQCSGCDKSFHRADLLVRHQQKHEDDGDHGVPALGPARRSPHPPPAAPSSQARDSPGASGPTSTASPSATAIAPTSSVAVGNQSSVSQGGKSAYRVDPGIPSQSFYNPYTPTLSIVDPAPSSSLAVPYLGALEYQPRNGPPPIYVVTQGLESPNMQSVEVPDLHDGSAWPSSASDNSTYSTPVSDVSRNPRLSPYHETASRGLQSSAQTIEGIPAAQPRLFLNSYSNAQPSEHTYGSTLGVPSIGYSTAGLSHRRTSSNTSLDGTLGPHQHRHLNPLSPAHRQTPPLSTSSHGNETLLASPPSLFNHLDSMASINCRKAIMAEAHQDLLGSHAAMGPLAIMDGLAVRYGPSNSAASPKADDASHCSAISAELDLAMGDGCAMPVPLSMTIPLPGPVFAAIPGYLDIYWSEVDVAMPLIHRLSFEAAPEDVLRCAMAAVATQHLDNPEDRTRGNQLHEFAWQEVKRVPQWSLQTMQAILLCEYFARFRGRKAVTRPSKPFQSLFSRVSALRSFTVPPSFSTFPEHNGHWFVDTAAWSPPPSPASSTSSSLCGALTPTTTAMSPIALRHLSPLQTTPWGGFLSPLVRSLAPSSPFGNTFLSSSNSSTGFHLPRSSGVYCHLNLPSSPSASPSSSNPRSRAQPSWSSLIAPDCYSPATPAPVPSFSLSAPPPFQAPGHAYSQSFSNPQVLYHNPAYLDHTMLATDQHRLSIQERWRNWIEAESRRRLLAACVFCDEHAGVYHQQRRAQDSHAPAALQLPPLFGGNTKLWEASSAAAWANALAADPAALQPEYVPPLEHLTLGDVARRSQIDRMIIIAALSQRLPPRHRPGPAASLSANSSPAPKMDHHTHHVGSPPFHLDVSHHHHRQHTSSFLRHQSDDPAPSPQPDKKIIPPPSFDAEERISTVFGPCPVANTYLALHHTPLRDLLAVGGDSWVFSQKVLPATSFHEHQKRLRVWVSSAAAVANESSSNNNGHGTGTGTGLSVVRATVFAARALLGFLGRQPFLAAAAASSSSSVVTTTTTASHAQQHPQLQGEERVASGGGGGGGGECRGGVGKRNTAAAPWSMDMSDYWAMYVCALICWAFCHYHHHTHQAATTHPSSGGSGAATRSEGGSSAGPAAAAAAGTASNVRGRGSSSARATSSASRRPLTQSGEPVLLSVSAADDDDEEAVIAWLRMVAAAQGSRPEDVVRLRGRREAAGVVGLVRRRLEADCLGGRSRLYVDAVGVLRKIEEGSGWKWF
ncbi:hypothetical protein N658DRAFT_516938 [Parathielavia hyrcaniae]|uniref:C2H2-type domain-containing protein n=1 Tax=Parathielavia hyrcaniae TaxID=113614 RepID=A0AAN6T0Y9_9PEZI|nr:hypothetical protein N658DRAFT_516938 [Parathielavia hyrcaniae]